MISYKEILYKTKKNLFKFMKLVIIYQSCKKDRKEYLNSKLIAVYNYYYHINYHIIDLIMAKCIYKYNKNIK